MPSFHAPVAGLVLAAGAGSRYGGPKALVRDPDGVPWLRRVVRTLEAAGCAPVIVVLGAEGAAAESLLREPLSPAGEAAAGDAAAGDAAAGDAVPATVPGARIVVHAADWASGLSASLKAGLRAAADYTPGAGAGPRAVPVAVAVVPVDVPDLNPATVARMIGEWPGATGATVVDARTLRQARFDGRPGHPVVIGRAHWAALAEQLTGDTGARPYLAARAVVAIECRDLSTGADVDTSPEVRTAPGAGGDDGTTRSGPG